MNNKRVDEPTAGLSRDQLVEVSHVGLVTMIAVLSVRTYCRASMTDFPRDVHTCNITVAPSTYPGMVEIKYIGLIRQSYSVDSSG